MMPRQIVLILLVALPSVSHAETNPCKLTPATQNGKAGFIDCHQHFIPLQEDSRGSDTASIPSAEYSSGSAPASIPGSISSKVSEAKDNYALWVYTFQEKSYEWQYRETIVIFWVVIILVLSGLWLAFIQFNIVRRMNSLVSTATRMTDNSSSAEGDGSKERSDYLSQVQEFSIGKEGIAVKSSFIGVVILAISMGFFLLYLKYAYPIAETSTSTAHETVNNPDR